MKSNHTASLDLDWFYILDLDLRNSLISLDQTMFGKPNVNVARSKVR